MGTTKNYNVSQGPVKGFSVFYNTFQGTFENPSGGTGFIQCVLQHFSYSFQIPAKGYSAFTKAKGTVFKCDGKDTVYFTSLFKAREGENDADCDLEN